MKMVPKQLCALAAAAGALTGCVTASQAPTFTTVLPVTGEWALPLEGGKGWISTSERQGIALTSASGKLLDQWSVPAEFLDSRTVSRNNAQVQLFASVNPETSEPLLFTVDQNTQSLDQRIALPDTGFPAEGLCLYQDSVNGDLYLFLLSEHYKAHQYLVSAGLTAQPELIPVRDIPVAAGSESCAVDDTTGTLMVAEEGVGIWAYQAHPETEMTRTPVAMAAPFGELGNGPASIAIYPGGVFATELNQPTVYQFEQTASGYHHQGTIRYDVNVAPDTLTATVQNGVVQVIAYDENAEQLLETKERFSAPTSEATGAPVVVITPEVETTPVPTIADAADDPEIWVNPHHASRSLVLGTDKKSGLLVYNMEGQETQHLPVGRVNNVDLRYNAAYHGKTVDIAVASNRTRNSLSLFAIDREEGRVLPVTEVPTQLSEIYGICMYQSGSGTYAIANDKDGRFHQFRLTLEDDHWTGELVREFRVATQPEGCVANDRTGQLFVGEEDEAVWVVNAEPVASEPERIASAGGELTADIEGLSLYQGNDQDYLVVSSQGDDSYAVYNAAAPWEFRGKFRIGINHGKTIDGASETDGLAVTSANLGGVWSQGMLVVQDGRNVMPTEAQNFKYVPWSRISKALDLEH
jgi:3-phytase